MKKIFFCTLLGILLFANACVLRPKPLDVDIPEVEQQPVISSFAFAPQELLVTFTRTFSALITSEDSVTLADADIANLLLVDSGLVTLRYAGQTDTLFIIAPGVFASINAEQIDNEKYTLFAKDYKTGKEIIAETVLLPPVSLDSVMAEFVAPGDTSGFFDTLYTFRAKFNDPVGVDNYYLLTYTNISDFRGGLASLGANIFKFKPAQFAVLSDKNKGDGMPISFAPFTAGSVNDTLVVALSNIPKDYYEYLTAYKRSGSLFTQLIGEPISLPTNVSGGYGYFAMIRPKLKVVVLE
jgi:Domain of unknown function (DUF4249)